MLIVGTSPWRESCKSDDNFCCIINGELEYVLKYWNKMKYVNNDLIELLSSIFKLEENRPTIKEIKNCKWLNK